MLEGWKAKKLVAGLAEDVPPAVVEQFRALGDDAVDALVRGLRHGPQPVRAGAARVLGELGPARAIAPLAACSGELPAAASALAAIVSRAVRPRVFRAIQGTHDATMMLVALLTATAEPVRGEAEAALLRAGPQGAAVLASALEMDELRDAALRVLSKLGPGGTDVIVPLLEHKRKEVRRHAATALQSFGWSPGSRPEEAALAAAMQDWERCRALGGAAVERTMALAGDADSDVRQAAARLLGQLREPRSVPALIPLLGDHKDAVRLAAIEALGEIADPRAAAPLASLLRGNYDLRAPACRALQRIGWVPDAVADRVLLAILTEQREALADSAARQLLIEAACEEDYSILPEDVVLRGLPMLENAGPELLPILKRGGRRAAVAREILDSGRASEDQHVLCSRCLAYLGIRKELRNAGGRLHCGDCGASVTL